MGDEEEEEQGSSAGRALGIAPWGWEAMRMKKGVWNPWFLSLVFCHTGAIWKCRMVWRLCLEEEEREEEGVLTLPSQDRILEFSCFSCPRFPEGWAGCGTPQITRSSQPVPGPGLAGLW